MEKNEIERRIKEKYNDKYTIKMFTNFVVEFQECFSNIMGTEELINRIKEKVFGNIKIIDEFKNKSLDGRYGEDGYIYLKKSVLQNERYVKYLLFHEMLHAVTIVTDENGKEVMDGFSYLKNGYGMGLNEAMTEYLTQVRNEKVESYYGDLISGYRTIVEQIRRLILIIGDEELKKAYFYNPERLKEIFKNNKMNYDELELAFRELYGKDDDVYLMGNGKKLINNNNYKLHRFSKIIFKNYENAIGEINSLEDFKRKYKIFQTNVDYQCDCIITMTGEYYKKITQDISKLIKRGNSFDEIKEVLQDLNINVNVLQNMYSVARCFVKDKNETAVNLYEYYKKRPDEYISFFCQNYGMIFDYFREYDAEPNDEMLYTYLKYPLMGLLIKEDSDIEYSDVSYYDIKEKDINLNMFIFYTSDGKVHAYKLNGCKIPQYSDQDGNEKFEIKVNDECKCIWTCDKKDKTIKSLFTSTTGDVDVKELVEKVNFNIEHCYSEKEDLEYWIQEYGDADGFLTGKLDVIKRRMEKRKENNINR